MLIGFGVGGQKLQERRCHPTSATRTEQRGIEDTAINEPIPAVLSADVSVEQAQAAPLSLPADLRLEGRPYLGTASVVGAAVLETNVSSQSQDGLPVYGCIRFNHGLRLPSSWHEHNLKNVGKELYLLTLLMGSSEFLPLFS